MERGECEKKRVKLVENSSFMEKREWARNGHVE